MTSGSQTLKDALNEAMRDWVTNVENTFYIIGTVAGPHPYPMMVRDFQRVIGDECLAQMPAQIGRQPDAVIACVGGGSNAMGIFYPYIDHEGDAADRRRGRRRRHRQRHATRPRSSAARRACCTATAPTCCRTTNGQITETHSISAGLDYPGVGPEHAYLTDIGRAEYVGITDDEALDGLPPPVPHRGHHPGARVEPCGRLRDEAGADDARRTSILLVNLSGRGDKDIGHRGRRSRAPTSVLKGML